MVNTTSNEFPQAPKEPKETKAPKEPKTNDEKIVALYEKGKNLYDIAYAVFEFGGEEALERVRLVLRNNGYLDETHVTPDTRIVEE